MFTDARVTVTVGGWFDSLPPATKDFVMRKLHKGEQRNGWRVVFADQRGKPDLSEFDNL